MNKKIRNITIIVISIIIITILLSLFNSENRTYIGYKEFSQELENENIETVIIEDNSIQFTKKNDTNNYYTDNPNVDDFKEKLLLSGVRVDTNSNQEKIAFVFDILFYIFFFGIVVFAITKLYNTSSKNFKVIKHTNVKFTDIAGMEELKKEMMKTVEILKNYEEYNKKGIRPIKGIILEGNPGNGKTLFAKALAGEANINFIATKGADFQSAMMSMGAKKIKMLFKKAKRHKPCIIFIDEFDGIGERRNYAGTGVDKENNRIITAMLNEMDGFDTENGILVITATNSFNSLDPALIRPGRFDLKYNISDPDFNTRVELIDLYTNKKNLAEEIDKNKLADAFENLSCSAIETILNEASMIALLNNSEYITLDYIIIAGKKTNCNINLKKLRK